MFRKISKLFAVLLVASLLFSGCGNKNLTFDDLSKRDYSFCSGVGAWSEDFNIEKDGSFSGAYYDVDMGDAGDNYPNGTMYLSSYSGHLKEIKKISDNIYEVEVADLSYDLSDNSEEYVDGYRYIYTQTSCFMANKFTIYLPGTPIKDIPEDVYSWLSMMNESETELTSIALADLEIGIGIFSSERISQE